MQCSADGGVERAEYFFCLRPVCDAVQHAATTPQSRRVDAVLDYGFYDL
jgi:hypothetical protein